MRHDDDLRALRRLDNQAGQRRQQVRVEAGLRLVQHEKRRRTRRQQRRDPQQVAQGAVRQLTGAERPEQPTLLHLDAEPALGDADRDVRAREGVVDGGRQGLVVADDADRLERRREVAAVVTEHRGVRADLRQACRRPGVGAEVIVEAPAARRPAAASARPCAACPGRRDSPASSTATSARVRPTGPTRGRLPAPATRASRLD